MRLTVSLEGSAVVGAAVAEMAVGSAVGVGSAAVGSTAVSPTPTTDSTVGTTCSLLQAKKSPKPNQYSIYKTVATS